MERKIYDAPLDHLNLLKPDTDMSILNLLVEDYDLKPQQLQAVKESYLTDSCSAIEAIEMGLGKTVVSLGLLQMISPALHDSVAIITAPTNTILNFYNDVTNNTSLNVMMSTGKADEIADAINQINRGLINCLIVTPSAWTLSLEFNLFVFNNINKIRCFIWDECKGESDYGFNHFIEASHYVDFVFPLNATIMGKGVNMAYKMLYACTATDLSEREFKRKYGHYTMSPDGNKIYHIHWDEIKQDFGPYLVNFNREDVGAKTIYKRIMFHRCEVTPYQESFLDESTSRNILYAPHNDTTPPLIIPAIAELIKVIASYPTDENTLIYCRNIQPATTIYKLLTAMGYKVFRIDGSNTNTSELKLEAEKQYNETKGAIMITSISEGSNLNSTEHVVIFQNPTDVVQFIARAARGFNQKELTLDWIYYPKLEKDSFLRNIESAINVSAGSDRNIELLHIMVNEMKQMYPGDSMLQIYEDRIKNYSL